MNDLPQVFFAVMVLTGSLIIGTLCLNVAKNSLELFKLTRNKIALVASCLFGFTALSIFAYLALVIYFIIRG